ncbi:ribbon-helix-helix protein, CopG family [uncultured Deinococcus sp.]|uniref:ribbon-helix-helix protein, CopG family n=1 Tax=uncultured Deinococcus sp. TaxID=158789 RepID=UPI00338DB461
MKLDRVLPVRISAHMVNALELLAQRSGLSKSAVLRRCAALYIDYLALEGDAYDIPTHLGYQRFLRSCEEDDS